MAIKASIRGGHYHALQYALNRRLEFKTAGALKATTGRPWMGTGYLNREEEAEFSRDFQEIVYTVYSYATPIAWVTSDGRVHKVAQKFSVTTSKHQGFLWAMTQEVGYFDESYAKENSWNGKSDAEKEEVQQRAMSAWRAAREELRLS